MDPKPRVGPAAIESNIIYYKKITERLTARLKENQELLLYWQNQQAVQNQPLDFEPIDAQSDS